MTQMIERLISTGIKLKDPVGVIVEKSIGGKWTFSHARIVKVLGDLPETVDTTMDFDPRVDICTTWPGDSDSEIFIFSKRGRSNVFKLEGGGLVIQSEATRVFFGQDKKFIEETIRLWAQSEGGSFC